MRLRDDIYVLRRDMRSNLHSQSLSSLLFCLLVEFVGVDIEHSVVAYCNAVMAYAGKEK